MTPADAWQVEDPTLCPICGLEACEEHFPPSPDPEATSRGRGTTSPDGSPAAAGRLAFSAAADVISAPRAVEVVEGVAWAGSRTVLVSESGVGKTFVLLDLAASVSSGVSWHGRDVQQGSVAYLSFEGDALGSRLKALRDRAGHRLEHVYILRASDPLSPRVTRDGEDRSFGEIAVVAAFETLAAELRAAEGPPIRLIVVDTVRASMTGSEDSSEHVSAYLRAVHRIMARVPDAAVVLAHHAGWQDGDSQRKRERGSSAWRGNCDATIYLEAGEADEDGRQVELTLRTLKVRDDEKPGPLHLVRRRVDLLEMGRHGDPVTSCVIDRDRRSREDREADAEAAVKRAHYTADLQTLEAIVAHPEAATSQDRLRLLVGARKGSVSESLGRLLSRGWIELPSRQRQPYTVTETGQLALTTRVVPSGSH